MGRFLGVGDDRSAVMAATSRTPVGMDHVTVVPTNYDPDARDADANADTDADAGTDTDADAGT